MPFELNYDNLIHLDAEDLAETGIGRAYEAILPELRKYIEQPAAIEEVIDDDEPSYSVVYGSKKFVIYEPGKAEYEGWGLATFAFFSIVNDQLARSNIGLCAINGGNDLFGMFLTHEQAIEARKSLPNKRDWPYLPTDEDPWYGCPH